MYFTGRNKVLHFLVNFFNDFAKVCTLLFYVGTSMRKHTNHVKKLLQQKNMKFIIAKSEFVFVNITLMVNILKGLGIHIDAWPTRKCV